jgi:hypothetical protein
LSGSTATELYEASFYLLWLGNRIMNC